MPGTTNFLSLPSLRTVVPLSTALFGALGFSTGLFALLTPGAEPAKLFGILPPTSLDTNSEADRRQRAYIQIHGIRNLANGVGLFALTTFWRFSTTCRSSHAASSAVAKALAILLASGTIVGITDGLILSGYAQSEGLSKEAKDLALEKRTGHMTIMIPLFALAIGWWGL